MIEDPLLCAALTVGGLSTATMLGLSFWWFRRPTPAPDAVLRVLLGSPMAPRAFAYAFAVFVPSIAIGVLVPIATKELWPDTWIAHAGLLFTAAWLPMSVGGMLLATTRGVREAAQGELVLDGTQVTVRWGAQPRRFDLAGTHVVLELGTPLPAGDMGTLVITLDDGSEGPDGRVGGAVIAVPLPLAARHVRARWFEGCTWTRHPDGLPVLGWDAEIDAWVSRVVDGSASADVVRSARSS